MANNPEKSANKKIAEEIAHYAKVENVHELPPIFHYWSQNYLRPKIQALGFDNIDHIFVDYIEKASSGLGKKGCSIVSVGAGNCDFEVKLAKILEKKDMGKFRFVCLDINPHMLERGEKLARKERVAEKFEFLNTDINKWAIADTYNVVIANQSLHHFLDLEILFDKIHKALHPDGFFVIHDMIGRNGHMHWPEALELVHAFWSLLEDKHKYNQQLKRFEALYEDWDCSKEGFEGIRSQDILPLLMKTFTFDLFIGFSCLVPVFVGRSFGHNFALKNPWDKTFIDFVARLDDYFIELGKIKPVQMVAVMLKRQDGPIKTYKHLSPEFCVRMPDAKGDLVMSEKKPGNILTKLLKRN
ncbi:MAG: class I SAM-dependent methyltransferase [Nitrospirae bacterium]|nr:class I SAM-dependent methyltransferase [Nitrospirota bacterium]